MFISLFSPFSFFLVNQNIIITCISLNCWKFVYEMCIFYHARSMEHSESMYRAHIKVFRSAGCVIDNNLQTMNACNIDRSGLSGKIIVFLSVSHSSKTFELFFFSFVALWKFIDVHYCPSDWPLLIAIDIFICSDLFEEKFGHILLWNDFIYSFYVFHLKISIGFLTFTAVFCI